VLLWVSSRRCRAIFDFRYSVLTAVNLNFNDTVYKIGKSTLFAFSAGVASSSFSTCSLFVK